MAVAEARVPNRVAKSRMVGNLCLRTEVVAVEVEAEFGERDESRESHFRWHTCTADMQYRIGAELPTPGGSARFAV